LIQAALAILGLLASPSVWGEAGQLTDTSTPVSIVAMPPTIGLSSGTNTAAIDGSGALKVSFSAAGATKPGTTGAGESGNGRAYQTTYEITLPNAGVEQNVILMRNPSGSGKQAYIRNITFSNTLGAAKSSTLRVYSNPVVTSTGSTLTPTPGLLPHPLYLAPNQLHLHSGPS